MARVFVSYSRKNKEFCKRLADEFQERDIHIWVDWEGIPPTVDWMNEIQQAIEEADTFLAIVSTDWISSKVCKDELEIAVRNGKRLIPVIPEDIRWDEVPPALAQLNFIFFTGDQEFDTQFEKLFTALDTDYDWLKTHRRLQVKALEWERSDQENGYLLRGRDLEEAESQLSINANKDPRPTDLQHEYVLKSRQATDRQRKVTTGILIALVVIMLVTIGLLASPYVEEAIARAQARNQTPMMPVPAGNMEFWLEDVSQPVDFLAFEIETRPVPNQVYGLCVKVGKCTPPIGSTNPGGSKKNEENDPVAWITIDQAAAYCNWVGRRLPSAPEWEYAAGLYAQPAGDEDRFVITEFWEWTSSHTESVALEKIGEWDGQMDTLNIVDWRFLQERRKLDTPDELIIETNPSGAFGANQELSFRCAR